MRQRHTLIYRLRQSLLLLCVSPRAISVQFTGLSKRSTTVLITHQPEAKQLHTELIGVVKQVFVLFLSPSSSKRFRRKVEIVHNHDHNAWVAET